MAVSSVRQSSGSTDQRIAGASNSARTAAVAEPYFAQALGDAPVDHVKIAAILKQRTTKLSDIPEKIDFFKELPEYGRELYVNKKSKTNLENAPAMLKAVYDELEALPVWDRESIHDALISLAERLGVKNGTVMWPARISVAGKTVTPGGAIEILDILGREESLRRMAIGLEIVNS